MKGKHKINKINRENIQTFKHRISQQKYTYFLKHFDKKERVQTRIYQVIVYDKLDNHGMNLLMKKIHSLKKRKRFTVSTYFRRPGTKDLNYVSNNLEGYSMFSIAEVKMSDNIWIDKINIAGTNVTNSDIVVKYCFQLKKVVSSYQIMHNFILSHRNWIGKQQFHFLFYREAEKSFIDLLEQEEHIFYNCVQDYVCRLFCTEYGYVYSLPIEISGRLSGFNKKIEKKISKSLFSTVYKRENAIVEFQDYDDRFYAMSFYHGKCNYAFSLFHAFASFSVEMYYRAFRKIEISELENRMRKYLNSRRRSVSAKDIKWMINKLRGIEDKEQSLTNEISISNAKIEWAKYEKGSWKAENIISSNTNSSHFKYLYQNNLNYLKAISSTRESKVLYFISIVSLVIALLGLVFSLAFNLWQKDDVPSTNYNYYIDRRVERNFGEFLFQQKEKMK